MREMLQFHEKARKMVTHERGAQQSSQKLHIPENELHFFFSPNLLRHIWGRLRFELQ
jgi:hypothetical protein